MATTKRRPQQGQEKGTKAISPFPLEEEVRTYEAHRPEWADREGQFVLIKGHDIVGFYARQEAALEAGYDQFGSETFLVKQILLHEPIYQLGHIEL